MDSRLNMDSPSSRYGQENDGRTLATKPACVLSRKDQAQNNPQLRRNSEAMWSEATQINVQEDFDSEPW